MCVQVCMCVCVCVDMLVYMYYVSRSVGNSSGNVSDNTKNLALCVCGLCFCHLTSLACCEETSSLAPTSRLECLVTQG